MGIFGVALVGKAMQKSAEEESALVSFRISRRYFYSDTGGQASKNAKRKSEKAQPKHFEDVALKDKKGLARFSLRTGIPIVPAYSLGNTAAMSCWHDGLLFPKGPWIMEKLSRTFRASLFVPVGRWGLPADSEARPGDDGGPGARLAPRAGKRQRWTAR